MTKQSRLASFFESCGNTASGFVLSIVCQWGFLVLFLGLSMTWQHNLGFALFMTVISVARSYGWRRLMEALHVRVPLSPFMRAVIAERQRQQTVECWDEAHDDAHAPGELARAGASYALLFAQCREMSLSVWPWGWKWYKPKTDERRNLIVATALMVAEGEKFDRDRKPRLQPLERSPSPNAPTPVITIEADRFVVTQPAVRPAAVFAADAMSHNNSKGEV